MATLKLEETQETSIRKLITATLKAKEGEEDQKLSAEERSFIVDSATETLYDGFVALVNGVIDNEWDVFVGDEEDEDPDPDGEGESEEGDPADDDEVEDDDTIDAEYDEAA